MERKSTFPKSCLTNPYYSDYKNYFLEFRIPVYKRAKPMILRPLLILLILSIFSSSFTQTISPLTLNNGGGSYLGLEWSISESVSITPFIAPGFSLNTGVLQPNTSLVTSVNEYGPAVFGSQITMGPNPTSGVLHFKARFAEVGNLSIQLIDVKSSIVLTQEAGTIFNSYEKDISLEEYPSGVFYVKVFFKPIAGNIKTGIYKIIKL